ncbi:hypothetical protein SDRG_05865 [Saprolegnia diclina VS20]|uniref:WRKY19-like zinc finger domain-containing protein n=1 Tax=Saprolegnia diclina (strain VS20) TaxID=1156394 RepID=T0RV70_SAPDV|nr:hypothetical protein SDRG_05865 [Saprolegnia diclina VS20]EQC36408.1 hypothetical protein SDRG_05865 [Saprolegnia diclina VS20]|eukprot:XP_008609829.1 hypothetical protein SDRG_05865 [Saprolegnia diclina VS20]
MANRESSRSPKAEAYDETSGSSVVAKDDGNDAARPQPRLQLALQWPPPSDHDEAVWSALLDLAPPPPSFAGPPAATKASRARSKLSPPKEIHGQCLAAQCSTAITYRGFCKAHGGTRRCSVAYCPKNPQGGRYCIAHGGGKRCKADDCVRPVQSRGLCKAHGGGTRCKADECDKSAQSGGYCRAHGGIRICAVAGCPNGVQRHGKCAKHDGGRLCSAADCTRTDRGGGLCDLHRRRSVCSVVGCKKLLAATTVQTDVPERYCIAHKKALAAATDDASTKASA